MLALIAGSGALPTELVARLAEPPLICALEGAGPDDLTPELWFRLETLGSLVAELQRRGVSQLCMAGGIRRPRLDPSALDAATAPMVPLITQALKRGDDGALRAVIGVFETAGITVRAAHEIAPDLLPPAGCSTVAQPGEADGSDAERGAEIVAAMSVADVGQACVVMDGQALAIESVFGTDWMLSSLSARPDGGQGGLLFKAPKPGQDRRADLPAIGPQTIRLAAAAGLRGVVIETGGVMMLDGPGVIAECDRAGLFLWVRDKAG